MSNIKIHYIGFGTQTLLTDNMTDAMYHLGAKYGARLYNAGVRAGAIVLNAESGIINVDIDAMYEIESEIK